MDYFCAVCGITPVENRGDWCPACLAVQDPFSVSQSSIANTTQGQISISGSSAQKKVRTMLDDNDSGVIDETLGKLSSSAMRTLSSVSTTIHNSDGYTAPTTTGVRTSSSPIAGTQSSVTSLNNASVGSAFVVKGIVKNVVQDIDRRGVISRWFRALFLGSNFAIDSDITEFQLYPDFSGKTLNPQGFLADQVIVYGKIKQGTVSENNHVEIVGRRDQHGQVVASEIHNLATGSTEKPSMVLNRGTVVTLTLLLAAVVTYILATSGPGFFVNLVLFILFIIFLPVIVKIFLAIFGMLIAILGLLK